MYNFSDFFRNVQLHRIPFLTTELLTLLIPNMRNLTVLGIYNCPLIHIACGQKLLDIIQMDKPKEKENQITLDWYPSYHRGPKDIYTEYGAVWDNWNGDTRLAIWQLARDVLRRAKLQGIDMYSKGSAFRKWLDKGPCCNVEETIKAIMSDNVSAEEFVAWVNFPKYRGNVREVMKKWPNEPEGWRW